MVAVLHGVADTETLVACSKGVFPISKASSIILSGTWLRLARAEWYITKKKPTPSGFGRGDKVILDTIIIRGVSG